jgi:hypothetical protein
MMRVEMMWSAACFTHGGYDAEQGLPAGMEIKIE